MSVVITTYNHAHFLAEAIASVEAQTVPASEILVVAQIPTGVAMTSEPGKGAIFTISFPLCRASG